MIDLLPHDFIYKILLAAAKVGAPEFEHIISSIKAFYSISTTTLAVYKYSQVSILRRILKNIVISKTHFNLALELAVKEVDPKCTEDLKDVWTDDKITDEEITPATYFKAMRNHVLIARLAHFVSGVKAYHASYVWRMVNPEAALQFLKEFDKIMAVTAIYSYLYATKGLTKEVKEEIEAACLRSCSGRGISIRMVARSYSKTFRLA